MATASSTLCNGSDDLDLFCDVCQYQNKTSIAVSYCETCEEAFCETCDNVHRNLKVTRTHSLLTGDQLIDIKLAKQLRGFGYAQDNSHIDDSVPGRNKGTSLSIWNVFSRIKGTNRGGRGSDSRKTGTTGNHDSDPCFLDLTVSYIKHHKVGCFSVRSVVFMPSDRVVLACGYDGLKLLDKHFKQSSQLSLYSLCVCKVSDTKVLVSQGEKQQIQFVEVLPKLVPKNVLNIGKYSRGVCYRNGEIYVTCHDNPGNGEVRVVQMDGTVVRRLGFHDGTYLFTKPWDVKVNNAGDIVFVSDWSTHSVTCIDQKDQTVYRGIVLYKYTDTDLWNPTGMVVDRQDNVLVTDAASCIVHMINKKGKKHKTVLTRNDGLVNPWCLSYRHDDGLLAIGIDSGDWKALMTAKTSLT